MTTFDETLQDGKCEAEFDDENSKKMEDRAEMDSEGTVQSTSESYTEEDDVENSIAEGYF